MARQFGADDVYQEFEHFVEQALRSDGSMFTPGARIWTLENLTALHRHFNEQPDESSERFEKKLAGQLSGAPPEVVQLMAEVVHVALSIVDDTTMDAKKKSIRQVLELSSGKPPMDSALARVVPGIVGGGLSFKTLKPFQLWYLIDFVKAWKEQPAEQQREMLNDPWKFKAFAWTVPIDKGYAMREGLLHIVFPDTFESIISRDHKAQITRTFKHLVAEPAEDVDRLLLQIREAISKDAPAGWGFYDDERRPLWDPDPVDQDRWDTFASWAKLMLEASDLEAEERAYKLRLAERVGTVREAILADREWFELLTAAMRDKENNLLPWQAAASFLEGCEAEPDRAADALRALWAPDLPWHARTRLFTQRAPAGAERAPVPIMSFLMMGEDPARFPIFRPTPYSLGRELVGLKPLRRVFRWHVTYQQGLVFLDSMLAQLRERGIELPDRLDAQGLLWKIATADPPAEWSAEDKRAFLAWRESKGEAMPPRGVTRQTPPAYAATPRTETLTGLADELYLPEEFLADTMALLRERKQVIFYGPPGTGKTFVARRLASYLAPDEAKREVVQFHPSYSYEDFVHGYRPSGSGKGLTYELTAGPLKRLAARAAEAPEAEHVLVIDEINRGNLPKILGELLYLLEYRGDHATLMYGDERFALPENLLIIGTMNTADRSIGLIDAALRRRFHFVPFFPGEGPLRTVLLDWLADRKPEMRHVAAIVDHLNEVLRARFNKHLQIGHSYFLRSDLSEEVLSRIWEYDVMPFLEDNLFGQDDELKAFELSRLRGATVTDEDDQLEGALADEDESDA